MRLELRDRLVPVGRLRDRHRLQASEQQHLAEVPAEAVVAPVVPQHRTADRARHNAPQP